MKGEAQEAAVVGVVETVAAVEEEDHLTHQSTLTL